MKNHILSEENLITARDIKMPKMKWKITICPHCKAELRFLGFIMPKFICYKCGKIVDRILKFEELNK